MILQFTQHTVFVLEDYKNPGHNALLYFRRILSFYPTWDPPVDTEVLGLRLVQFTEDGRAALMVELPDNVSDYSLETFAAHMKDRSYIAFKCEVQYNRNLNNIGWSLFLSMLSNKKAVQEITFDRRKVFEGVEDTKAAAEKLIAAVKNR